MSNATPSAQRSGDIRHSVADVHQACQVMVLEASVSLPEGLESYVAWLRAAHGAK